MGQIEMHLLSKNFSLFKHWQPEPFWDELMVTQYYLLEHTELVLKWAGNNETITLLSFVYY